MQYRLFDMDEYRRSMRALIGEEPKTKVFWDALDFACAAHSSQWRRSGDPYIMHPCSVAKILAEELDIRDPEILAAALLHDTMEDVEEVTAEVLREKFGPNVEAIVEGCTKVTHYHGSKHEFKKEVHQKIFTGAAARLEVMLVKLADRLHNMRTLGSMSRDRRQRISSETLHIYAPLATILGLFAIKRELYNLALAFKFPKQGNRLKARINKMKENPLMLAIEERLQEALDQEGVEGKVTMRTKGLWGYYDVQHDVLMKEIESPQEFLVVVKDRSACYQALGIVNKLYPPVPRTIRDFIANPKPTGYQGLHARPNINGRKYLFKIRTEEMARLAQRGMVRDWGAKSKEKTKFFQKIQKRFNILGSEEAGSSYRDMIAISGQKEIYTYTPMGDLICLPVHAIVLDFAFSVHTKIGHTCIGAMIGKQQVGIDQELRDGNIVRIIRQEEPVQFPPELQLRCKTPLARSELARTFRLRSDEVCRQIGLSILAQELRRYGIPREILAKEELAEICTYFGVDSMEKLYLFLGQGKIHLRELIYEISDNLYTGRPMLSVPTGGFNRVDLATIDPAAIKFSSCCKPTPLDKGLISLLSERGLSLHRKDCQDLAKLHFQRDDAVEVRWRAKNAVLDKTQKAIFLNISRSRLLAMIASAPEEMRVAEILYLGKDPLTAADWEVNFQVHNLYGLKKIDRHFSRASLSYIIAFEQ